MKFWDSGWSNAYWGVWILLLFGVPEVLGHFKILPIMTLSRTAWYDEAEWPFLRTILLGFLVGLAVHIVFRTPLGWTMLAAIALSALVHLAWAPVP